MSATRAEEKITALYERLSRDDDLAGDSNSVINQKNTWRATPRTTGMETVSTTPMTDGRAAISSAPHGNGWCLTSRPEKWPWY